MESQQSEDFQESEAIFKPKKRRNLRKVRQNSDDDEEPAQDETS